ncbi:hypothetical protein, partial [Cellulosimicrobium sp. CpK407]|uniref:hypothetical protein n=1 Tax=Cellulosimicrobium sp. CpK407 TaxID=3229847 RepID=UPI003F3D6FCC
SPPPPLYLGGPRLYLGDTAAEQNSSLVAGPAGHEGAARARLARAAPPDEPVRRADDDARARP